MSTSTADGTTTTSGIAYRVQGAADGVPVVALHGTPGSRFSGTPARDALNALGLRVLTFDRPGYGDTPGGEPRTARELAQDILDVLEHAGVEGPAGILAAGGATPGALALAALHPERVGALTLVWPLAPSSGDAGSPAMEPHEWVRGMEEQQRMLHAVALQDPVFLRDQLELGLGAHAGAEGIVLDLLQVQEPWGVDPADVRCPVDVWWGTDSAVSPAAHAVWLSDHLTGAQVREHAQEEHQWHVRRLVEVFAQLAERLGVEPLSAQELAAASAAVDTDGCGGGRIGGCACGAGGCGA
ncbi:alpha/beta hydrolase [Ornithinimicrobium humiphilum]|uniref:Pimeloyl-ACP methyl ester carboxylesterase n=1 Tax=Ornithinimicrobium humiphilum TaxID=125288 RepID=A0A543KLU7_9MICO|nr:alpha/beta hydrolase [Ornithinimicrobium humiphilum]TQM96051.1 pimeloyl-ACP methyl ester carboxylesterase [Ornithinimicrobium humiphilum]